MNTQTFPHLHCPDDESLFDFALGRSSAVQTEAITAHLPGCENCRRVLAAAATGLGEESLVRGVNVEQTIFDPNADPLISGGATVPQHLLVASEISSSSENVLAGLSRYDLEETLGNGAMGVVYRAHDRVLNRQVAIKLLRPDLRGKASVHSVILEQEAQAMARLSHPNVATVHDVGTDAMGVFIVMEYVAGGTLKNWLKQGPELSEVRRALLEAGRGLAAAHAQGLVHGDFKPANVLMGSDGRARVADFGLAQAKSTEDDDWSTDISLSEATVSRGWKGTPAFMAPEAFEGGGNSQLSDQFSYSVALYMALYGEHPFQADGVERLQELLERTRRGLIKRPLDTPSIPEDVHLALLRGMHPDPKQRFPSLEPLLDILEAAVFEVPAQGSRSPSRFLLASFLVAVSLLVVGAVVVERRAPETRAEASQQRSAVAEMSPESDERTMHASALNSPSSEASKQTEPAEEIEALPEPPPTGKPSSAEPTATSKAAREKHRSPTAPPKKAKSREVAPRATAAQVGDVRYRDELREPF